MTLAFSTHFPKDKEMLSLKPTYFVEKIWQSYQSELTAENFDGYLTGLENRKYNFHIDAVDFRPKLHSFRKDEKNLWKAGNKIHPVIHNRTPKRFQFAPTVNCVSTQAVEIVWNYNNLAKKEKHPGVFIDGKEIDFETLVRLAVNDGFKNIVEFFTYFNTNFTGKIIHWTNLKY